MKTNLLNPHQKTNRAFTLIELLVLMTIIAILAGLALPFLYGSTERAQGVRCGKNLRQLGIAWTLYAGDNENRVALNRPDPGTQFPHNWAAGWMDKSTSNTDNTNRTLLQKGQIGAYIQDLSVYKCPGDRLTVKVGGQDTPRVRSVAMNFYVGFKSIGLADQWQEVMKTSDMIHPDPKETFILAVQREDGINDTRYRVDADRGLVENPASYHNAGDNLVFGDGHVELHRWLDRRTRPAINRAKTSWRVGPNVGEGWTDENPDINWLRRHASAKRPEEPVEIANN